jgi:hypothetical protein
MNAIAALALALTSTIVVPGRDLLHDSPWLVEHDDTSVAHRSRGADGQLTFHFVLGSDRPRAQFAALVTPIAGGLTGYTRVTVTARATRPMRINVDLRQARPSAAPDTPARATRSRRSPRWRRSVYLDQTARTVTIAFDDMRPIDGGIGAAPLATIDALMFVVDTNNTRPATGGDVTFAAVALER